MCYYHFDDLEKSHSEFSQVARVEQNLVILADVQKYGETGAPSSVLAKAKQDGLLVMAQQDAVFTVG